MKKKIIKILCVIAVILGIALSTHVVLASDVTGLFDGTAEGGGVDPSKGIALTTDVIGKILSVIRIVAVSLAIVVLTFLGIKYMLAAPSEKAEIKKQYITFVIGVIVFVAATTILDLIKGFAASFGV